MPWKCRYSAVRQVDASILAAAGSESEAVRVLAGKPMYASSSSHTHEAKAGFTEASTWPASTGQAAAQCSTFQLA